MLKQRQTSLCLAHNGPVLHNNSPFRELGGAFRQWLRQHPLLGQRKEAGEALGGIDKPTMPLCWGKGLALQPPTTLAWCCVLSLDPLTGQFKGWGWKTPHSLQFPPLQARGIIFLAFNCTPPSNGVVVT